MQHRWVDERKAPRVLTPMEVVTLPSADIEGHIDPRIQHVQGPLLRKSIVCKR